MSAQRPLPLDGRVVLVTGGSRGIGRAIVATCLRDGAEVVAHYGNPDRRPADLLRDLGDDTGRLRFVQGDLTDPSQRDRVWHEALTAHGRVDVLVNNAGAWIATPVESPTEWSQGWQDNLALNLVAPADLCRNAIAHFRGRGGGIIVNLASRSSHRGDDAMHLGYGAAKGGLLALTKGIARGYAGEGILAYAVAPGWVATDLAAADPDVAARAASLPLGEVTPPEDVAEVVAFLASGRSRHTTGATIDITGADYVR